MIRRPHVPRTRYQLTRYLHSSSSDCCRCSRQQVHRSYCCMKKVTPLESSHGHHLPTRAASARAARGRCFDSKRAATAPGCRACSASPEHRVGSLLLAIRLFMAGNIRDGTGRYCFDMFGGKKIEDGTGRDGGCQFSRRDGTVQYDDLFVS